MDITFYGASREVTGSLILVKTDKYKFIVDCGFFQGDEDDYFRNKKAFDFNVKDIDFVLLTHSHVDHCGRLPLLVKSGFKNKIYATPATKDILYYILLDAVLVMQNNWKKYRRAPLYTQSEVLRTVEQVETYDYYNTFSPNEDVFVTFKNSGHILGSSLIEISIHENSKAHKLVFTGDVGNTLTPIIKSTDFVNGCDTLVIESTYGNKLHKGIDRRKNDLFSAIDKTIKSGGSVLIPAFSIERTEEILYDLNDLINSDKIKNIPVYLDSPLSKNILNVYRKYEHLFNDVALKKIKSGDDIFNFPNFNIIGDSLESLKVINDRSPKIILAGSGMLSGGRIINYLPIYLTQKNNSVVFISYQAKNTIGEKLIQNRKNVYVEGRKVRVKCNIYQISAYSSHADKRKLHSFVKNIKHPIPKNIFINHGDVDQSLGFKHELSKKSKAKITIPEPNKNYII